MRVAVYGAGAMGTVLGAYIAKAGKDIDLVSRNRAHVAALKSTGAHIVGGVDFIQPVHALLPEELTGKYDLVFLMTKQSQNDEIISFLQPYLSENGVIATLQNGLPEERIAQKIGKDNTYGCAVAWGANFLGEGKSELTSSPESMTFSLGCYGEADKRIDAIKEYLECAGEVTVTDNLIGARWAKLTINAAFSGISALTGLTFGAIAGHVIARDVALAVMNECFEVAEKAGIVPEKVQGHDLNRIFRTHTPFRRWISRLLLPLAMKKHAKLSSGMLWALKKGQKCEIDYINGIVCSFGQKYEVRTPVCDRICRFVHEIEDAKRSIGPENLQELKEVL